MTARTDLDYGALPREWRSEVDRLRQMLWDLDRCVHGRHEGDPCGSCKGPSRGNPHAAVIVGYDMSARPVTAASLRAAVDGVR